MRDALWSTVNLLGLAVMAVAVAAGIVDGATDAHACVGYVEAEVAPRRPPVGCPGGAAIGRVTIGETLILGTAPGDMCARIERRLPLLAACAERSPLGGRVTIRASLAADGDVVAHNSAGYAGEVGRCLADVLGGLDVPVFGETALLAFEIDVAPWRGAAIAPADRREVGGVPRSWLLVAP